MTQVVFLELTDNDTSSIFRYLYENAGIKVALKYRKLFDILYQDLEKISR
jgi:plasmid stabilization system protein ParE